MDNKFLKFIIVGLTNSFLTLIIIILLNKYSNLWYVISNFIGFFIGFINSFFLNKIWTFKNKNKFLKTFLLFNFIFLINYSCNLGAIYLFNFIGFDVIYSQIGGAILYLILGYYLNKEIVFK